MRDQPPYPPDVKALQECLIDGEESDLDVVDTYSFMGQLHVSHVSLCILSYYPPEAYNKQIFFSYPSFLISSAGRRGGGR